MAHLASSQFGVVGSLGALSQPIRHFQRLVFSFTKKGLFKSPPRSICQTSRNWRSSQLFRTVFQHTTQPGGAQGAFLHPKPVPLWGHKPKKTPFWESESLLQGGFGGETLCVGGRLLKPLLSVSSDSREGGLIINSKKRTAGCLGQILGRAPTRRRVPPY